LLQRYGIDRAYPAGQCRYLIRRIEDGEVVACDIEDRMYAALLCEAFNLLGERAFFVKADALCTGLSLVIPRTGHE
jgi:hypothetical protein